MFGYVLPRGDKLSQEGKDRYHAAYCGLCRCLKLRYGFHCRFLVNYDMTFLYFLLETGEPKEAVPCFCPARVFCKKDCLPEDPVMDYAADLTVLFSYWKLRDARRDDGFFKKIGAGCAMLLYKRAYKKAAKRRPEADEDFSRQLENLQKLEDSCCPSLDRPAHAFAQMLRICAAPVEDEGQRRAMEQLLYHVGRYLYLADALEDLPRDLKTGSYNPIRYRYELKDGELTAEDKKQFLQTVDASVDMAASALELLQDNGEDEILKNIVYYGLTAVLHSVADGNFRKRGKNK